MSRPIKETPILYGEDAIRFLKNMEIAENTKMDPEKKKIISDDYEKLRRIQEFDKK